jgi:hypothetical protein
MKGWSGDTDAHGWRVVTASIQDLTGHQGTNDSSTSRGKAFHRDTPSICVLPFANMSDDPQQARDTADPQGRRA